MEKSKETKSNVAKLAAILDRSLHNLPLKCTVHMKPRLECDLSLKVEKIALARQYL